MRRKKLKCRPLFEIVCLLYCYTRVVSDDVRKNRLDSLKAFVDGRLVRHMGDYFAQNNQITTALFFPRMSSIFCEKAIKKYKTRQEARPNASANISAEDEKPKISRG